MSVSWLMGAGESVPVERAELPDRAPHVTIPTNGPLSPQRVDVRGSRDGIRDLVVALTAVELARSLNREVDLFLPYVPCARQDRAEGATAFSLATVAKMIRAVDPRRVWVVDPHSDVTPALLGPRCEVVKAFAVVASNAERFRGIDGVLAPDAGAARRAADVATVLRVPLEQCLKKRDPSTGALSGFSTPSGLRGTWLVVDDICDGGGTFLGLADSLEKTSPEARPWLYVTHGIFSKGTAILRNHYERILTTDSWERSVDDAVEILTLDPWRKP